MTSSPTETAGHARAGLGHDPGQVAALAGRERGRPLACSRPARILASPGLIPAALTWTSTWPAPGRRARHIHHLQDVDPPYSSNRTAFTGVLLSPGLLSRSSQPPATPPICRPTLAPGACRRPRRVPLWPKAGIVRGWWRWPPTRRRCGPRSPWRPAGSWPLTGAEAGDGVWGECQGSAAAPYRTAVDLSGPAYRCSCPSRKFPCKHALALLLLWSDGAVANARRRARTGLRLGSPLGRRGSVTPTDPKAARRPRGRAPPGRATRGPGRVRPGRTRPVAVRSGPSGPGGQPAVRLPALGRHRRPHGRRAGAGPGRTPPRPGRGPALRPRLGGQAAGGVRAAPAARHRLPRAGRAAATAAGHRPVADRLHRAPGRRPGQRPPVRDHWHVLARRDLDRDRIRTRRVWLRGARSGRYALVLSFARPASRSTTR